MTAASRQEPGDPMMLVLLLLALASPWVTALDNGLAHTPQVRPAAATPPLTHAELAPRALR
jgi:hypothetical protein